MRLEICPQLPSMKDAMLLQHVGQLLDLQIHDLDLASSFVAQGGHSLLAIKLASLCKRSGIKVNVGNILLSETLADLCASAKVTEAILITELPGSGTSTPSSLEDSVYLSDTETLSNPLSIPASLRPKATRSTMPSVISQPSQPLPKETVARAGEAALTEMQMSFMHSFANTPGTNNIDYFETYRTKDVPLVKKGWRAVIDTEPIFRLSFLAADTGRAFLADKAAFKWHETIYHTRADYTEALYADSFPEEMEVRFDVITLATEKISTVVWRVHHAFIDGVSAQLIYNKLRNRLMDEKIRPGTPFDDVIKSLQQHQNDSRDEHRQFWAEVAKKHPSPAAELNIGNQLELDTRGVDSVTFSVPIHEINVKARSAGVSMSAWFQAAWALVLSMYGDSDSVVFGTVLAGRNLPIDGVDDTVGPLINTLPFHVSLDGKATVAQYLHSVFRHSVELSNVHASVPDDGFTRNFKTALAMEFVMKPTDDYAVRPIEASWFKAVPDIPLSVYHANDGTLRLCYQKKKYTKEDMAILAGHFRNAILLLQSLTKTVDQLMDSLITKESRLTLLKYGNVINGETSLPAIQDDLVTLFERVVREHPDSVAIEKSDVTLTYAELDKLAGTLAHRLQPHVAPQDVVCVHADRSMNWIVAIWGILKVGAICSAQDSKLPPNIRDANFQTACARVFLVPHAEDKNIKPHSCDMVLSVEELLAEPAEKHETIAPRTTPRQTDNAYLCFTSGSTGKPKGVMCHHAGLVAFQKAHEVRLFSKPGARISQLMSPAFDGSIHEIFSALTYGATLVLAEVSGDPFAHLGRATASILTPSIAKILEPEDFPMLETVYLVGEPVPQYVNDVWSSVKRLYNMYGPTEAICGATIQRLTPGKKVNIGPPNPTTRIYILDRNQRLVPPGVVGEIYCAGVQVANGYLGRPELTSERFLPDTIVSRPGEMMYRTGDRGYFNTEGAAECLGRNDRQIKLRGFRTDMNDLETRVAQSDAAITAVAICPKDDYLICMVQPANLDVNHIRIEATKRMPVHCVPRHIIAVDKFPMTPAGKVDYKAITEAAVAKPVKKTARKMVTHTETTLAKAWRDVLGLPEDVDIDGESNFIALGGHSVMQLKMAGCLSTLFGVKVPLSFIVKTANLTALGEAIEELCAKNQVEITPNANPEPAETKKNVAPLGKTKLSPIEKDWWQKYQLQLGSSSFNVTYACDLDADSVNAEYLIASWNFVLARHRIFRSRYLDDPTGPRRAYAKYAPQVTRVKGFSLWREVNRPFHLDREHPVRIIMSKTMVLVSMSHIVADLNTLQTVLGEVLRVYNGEGLAPVQRAYDATTQWSSQPTVQQSKWWSDYLAGSGKRDYNIPQLELNRTSYGGRTRLTKLPTELAERVMAYTESHPTTLHQLGLASVALALQAHHDETDIVLGAPYLNRSEQDLDTVGLFLAPLPIRIKHSAARGSSTEAYLASVAQASLDAVGNAIAWDEIQRAAGVREADLPNHPILDVMVTFHDQRTGQSRMRGVEPLVTYAKGSKFLLLVEFCAFGPDAAVIRMEYDGACISDRVLVGVQRQILEALGMIVDGGRTYAAVKEKLRTWRGVRVEEAEVSWFGKRVSKLAARDDRATSKM